MDISTTIFYYHANKIKKNVEKNTYDWVEEDLHLRKIHFNERRFTRIDE
jgi:hypothetical protein